MDKLLTVELGIAGNIWYADIPGPPGDPLKPPQDGDWGAPGHVWATATGATPEEAASKALALVKTRMVLLPLESCVCGDARLDGVVHRAEGPCYWPDKTGNGLHVAPSSLPQIMAEIGSLESIVFALALEDGADMDPHAPQLVAQRTRVRAEIERALQEAPGPT